MNFSKDPEKSNRYDLTVGNNQLMRSLENQYPNLSDLDREILGNALLNRVSNTIDTGGKIGSLHPTPEGNLELRIIDILPLRGNKDDNYESK